MAAGALPAIVRALEVHSSEALVAGAGCGARSVLAEGGLHHAEIAAAGGIRAVVACLKTHATVHRGMRAIIGAAFHLTAGSGSMRASFAEIGGIEATVTYLQRHVGHEAVAGRGCAALAVFARHADTAAAAASGIPAVVAALAAHCHVAHVAQVACWSLAGFGQVKGAVASSSATLPATLDVCCAAAEAATGHFTLQSVWHRIAAADGVPPLVAALTAHADNEMVAANATVELARIAADTSHHDLLVSSGVPAAALKAVSVRSPPAAIVIEVCALLRDLGGREGVRREGVRRAVAAAGGAETLRAAAADHASDPDVAIAVDVALASLGVVSAMELASDDLPLIARLTRIMRDA